jgi:ligand-binding sensor domain-containing protein
MWIGTGNGLFHYDGNSFTYIQAPEKQEAIPVSAIFRSSDHVLWIGTRKGEIFQLKNDSLHIFNPEEGNPKAEITGFASDKSGNLWFSTYGEGLYCFDGKRITNLNSDDGLTDNYCYTLAPDELGRIWVATDGGISVCSISNGKKSIQKITTTEGLPDNMVLSLTCDGATMWVGMQDAGICSVDLQTLAITPVAITGNWKYGPVNDIVTGKNWLWLSTEQNGIVSIESSTGITNGNFTVSDNLNISRISHLYADKQGNYWIVTGNQLLLSLGNDLIQFSEINQVSGKNIHSLLIARNGDVWFSNDKGLFTISKQTQVLKETKLPIAKGAQVISLFEDEKGRVWAGTFGNGLLCIHPELNQVRLFGEPDGLTNGNILSITGKGNQMWFATLGGAYMCNISENPFAKGAQIDFINKSDQQFPGNNYIYSVFIDSRNRIWFGTDGKGITMLENSRFTRFDKLNGLKSNIVYSITEDSDGGIWFSTANAGIYCYKDKILHNYSLAEGLSDLHITGLLADKNHQLLIVHNNGIDILDTRTNTFLYYTASIGLSEINPDLNVCGLEGNDIAWLGTQKGIIRLQFPTDISKRQPSLEIHKVTVFLGSENFIGIHRFAHNQNHISFHFNAYWFIEPAVVRYQIRLKGYDLDWIDTRNNLVTYSNLPPGDYTFEVRSSLKGNFNQSAVKSYAFTIKKPFWQTNWFIIVSVLSVTLLIYFIIRYRESALKKSEAIDREKLMFQFQTLRSQVNPHFLFNSFSTLISVIDEDKEVAIEYVEKLSLFFRNILEYRDKDLIPLNEELKLIETYFYLQKKRYCDNLQLTVDIRGKTLTSMIPPMVLQMLVENAIKHSVISAERPLAVEIIADEKYITVTNNLQRKKDKEPSTGIGLTNIRNRYALLGFGEIRIDSANDRFIVQLPIIYTEK